MVAQSSVSSFLCFCNTIRGGYSAVCLTPTNSISQPHKLQIIYYWKQQRSAKCTNKSPVSRWKARRCEGQELLKVNKDEGYLPDCHTLRTQMLSYSYKGLDSQALAIWDELLHSSFVPDIEFVLELFNTYGRMGKFAEIIRILHHFNVRGFDSLLPKAYSAAIFCLGRSGQLELMKNALRDFQSLGLQMDSATANAFVKYYSMFGSLLEMEGAYVHIKKSGALIECEGIRAIASAYIKNRKYYKLGEFAKDVGLGRKNSGNLLWNLLLLSYAVNFKMKTLQREFLNMVNAGFRPDITTFNIRALAFSKMSLFWDLHLSLEHMRHENVTPDLVTYGCLVDAYLDKRLSKNLPFALNKMNVSDYPSITTDNLVFEALGKGDFHMNSDSFLEFSRHENWTYKKLIATYLKKKYRSNQVFWNY